jgi:small subunit ribosomal protein S6
VQKYNEGVYVLIQFSSSPDLVKEVERRMRVTDMVIKFITVRIDEKAKKIEKRKKQREKRAARRPAPPPMAVPSAPAAPALPSEPAPVAPGLPGASAAAAETPVSSPVSSKES